MMIKFQVEKLKRRDHFADLGANGISLKQKV
jgi:hypothetical protein